MISGAAICFYSFVGFDAIATTGEEVLNPQRDLPIGIVLSLIIVTIAYCGVSAVQTLMWPFWDQVSGLEENGQSLVDIRKQLNLFVTFFQNQKAPLPYVFEQVGFPFAKNVITVGALAGLSTSLLGAMFPLPRILFAMAEDGLLFKFLGNISPRFKTPVAATIISGLFSAIMATFFNVTQLAEMMSIGGYKLKLYILFTIVLVFRYTACLLTGGHIDPHSQVSKQSVCRSLRFNHHFLVDTKKKIRLSLEPWMPFKVQSTPKVEQIFTKAHCLVECST